MSESFNHPLSQMYTKDDKFLTVNKFFRRRHGIIITRSCKRTISQVKSHHRSYNTIKNSISRKRPYVYKLRYVSIIIDIPLSRIADHVIRSYYGDYDDENDISESIDDYYDDI